MRSTIAGAALGALLLVSHAWAFNDDYARPLEIRQAEISPKGDYISILKEEDGKQIVAVLTYPDMELINVIDPPANTEVGDYAWVNDDRILVQFAFELPYSEEERSAGELYAVNADGSKGKYLFGFRADYAGGGQPKSRVQRVEAQTEAARLLHPRWQDEDKVLIAIQDLSRGYKSASSSAILDVYTGRLTQRIGAPTANSILVADNNGDARFSFYVDDDQNTIIYYRNSETNEWEEFSRAEYGESQITPYRMAADGRIYVGVAKDEGPEGLYLMDPKTQEKEMVYQNDLVDIGRVRADWQGNVYAVGATPDVPLMHFIDRKHPSAQLSMGLMNAFPNAVPVVTQTTHDYSKSIVRLIEDTRTIEFYLYNAETGELKLLFDVLDWIDDSKLSPMNPIKVTARDGLELHGYLTIPRNAKPKKLPLVVVPHGGPHGPRDFWGFPYFEGFIPANGYAMLQINFRGSGGYGMAFENKGYGEWDGKMMDDIVDATRWAIDKGIADPDRICIWGWSFGGYAALMSIIREPDLFQCSVGAAGVYDISIMYNSDFAERTRWGPKYLEKVIGDREAQERASPVNFVDQIKTPVLLIHPVEDARVPIENAYALQKAYERAGKKPPELIKLPKEGHSPRNAKNFYKYQKASIDFFRKYIGKGVMPKADKT